MQDLVPNGSKPNRTSMEYPAGNPQKRSTDTLSRLQPVVQYHTAGIEAQHRAIKQLSNAVNSLSVEVARTESMAIALTRELQTQSIAPVASAQPCLRGSLDDSTLEILAKNISSVASRVSEVDALKIQFEVLERRLRILEEALSASRFPPHDSASMLSIGPLASSRKANKQKQSDPMQHCPHSGKHSPPPSSPLQEPSFRVSSRMPGESSPNRTELRPSPQPALPRQTDIAICEEIRGISKSESQSSRQTRIGNQVSANVKARIHYLGVDNTVDARLDTKRSLERQLLAALEPHFEVKSTPASILSGQEPAGRTGRDLRMDSPRVQQQDSSIVRTDFMQCDPGQQPRPKTQLHLGIERAPAHTSRESRSGRDSGSFGSDQGLPVDSRGLSTTESGASGCQAEPEGSHHREVTAKDTKTSQRIKPVRRSSRGSGPISINPTGLTQPTSGTYAHYHAKKTRARPIRNAHGILIRKDGRPDMRSQSSAANLRKYRARKEQARNLKQRTGSAKLGPASRPMNDSSGQDDTVRRSPLGKSNVTSNSQDLHEAIMKRMFPNGVNDQCYRRKLYDRFFNQVP
ncbi:hypothetical protein B0J12DRAFT_705687 [Macrophomina phaseolina]|uniref:Uncharacterized protein n=1 Tax=Macrophomina phaseolina TaxID=35725 RepID=A0ABQ8FRC7_9PEZI|nr:hypothetical protein B0J12DRAFT_705687 [Macrophomina phaseolina]